MLSVTASRRLTRPIRPATRRALSESRRRQPSRGADRVHFVISEVPHVRQRYETVGDWIPGKPVKIKISKMKDKRYVFLVALHELLEYELCRMKGITDRKVVEFDKSFENERRMRLQPWDAEPGDDPRAPYRHEHGFATEIEKVVARKLGVSWTHYERTVLSLNQRRTLRREPMVGDLPTARARSQAPISFPSWSEK